MASNIHFDARRRHWWIKWYDGTTWRKKVIGRPPEGWKGKREPPIPPEVLERAAELVAAERAARSLDRPAAAQEVGDFLEAYRAARAMRCAVGSDTVLRIAIGHFLDFCRGRGVSRVEQVDRPLVKAFLAHRAGQGKASSTIMGQAGLLSGAWSEAIGLGRLTANPWAKHKSPVKEVRKKRGSWTPEQFARLHEASPPWLREVLVLGTQTGIRITALLSLGWEHVEWATPDEKGFGRVVVPDELDKAGPGYSVPMSRAAHDLLARILLERGDGGTILRGKMGRAMKKSRTDQAIRTFCARAGLPEPDSPNHHLRRSFGRWAVLGLLTGRPVPVYVVSRWMGHASISMTQRYLQLDEDTSADWMEEK